MPRVNARESTPQEIQLVIAKALAGLESFECFVIDGYDENGDAAKFIYDALASSFLNAKILRYKFFIFSNEIQHYFVFLEQNNPKEKCSVSSVMANEANNFLGMLGAAIETLKARFSDVEFELKAPVLKVFESSKDIFDAILLLNPELFNPFIVNPAGFDVVLEEALHDRFSSNFTLKSALKTAAKQAVPLWLAMTTFTASSFVNLSVYSTSDTNALLSSVIVLTLQRTLWALNATPLTSILINISRAISTEPERIGKIFQSGILFSALLGTGNALITHYAVSPFLGLLKVPDDLLKTTADTFRAYSLGFLGHAFMELNIKTLIAFKKPHVIMLCSLLASAAGIFSVYSLTNGYYGLPNCGGAAGYGYGLTIQSWTLSLLMSAYMIFSELRKKYKLFNYHPGVLPEFYRNFKQGMPVFFQRNADVFGTFSLAVLASKIGPVALIVENIVESYRLVFGRVGINSVSQALTGLMSNKVGLMQSVITKKLNPSQKLRELILNDVKILRKAGFVLTTIHSGLWYLLYAAIPRPLSSVFIDSEYFTQYPNLEKTIRNTLLISGAGQFFDDFRQVYMAEFNANKRLTVSTLLPNVFNFIAMSVLAYFLGISADLGAEGLELSNSIMFFVVAMFFFTPIANYYAKDSEKKLNEPQSNFDLSRGMSGRINIRLISDPVLDLSIVSVEHGEDDKNTPLLQKTP